MSGINTADFRRYLIEPSLELCADLASVPNTPYIRDLLVATCAQESAMGAYLHQTGRGPAVSIYQFEPTTLEDLLKNYASSKRFAPLVAAVRVPAVAAEDEIMWNLRFATVCARLNYYRVKEPLPTVVSFDTLWHYYKQYWNTEAGAATPATFRDALKLTDIRV